MTINEIKDFIAGRRGYLKKSADVLSERLNCPIEDCETALYEARKLAREENNDNDNSVVSSADILTAVEGLMGCGELTSLLTTKMMERGKAGGRKSVTVVAYNKAKAEAARDAVIKSVYTHLFDWVVAKVNSFLIKNEADTKLPYVGLLDIFGFENFKHNSFEQLCINFANEKLHRMFIEAIFEAVLAEYQKEGIDVGDMTYDDNASVIELIEAPRTGILLISD